MSIHHGGLHDVNIDGNSRSWKSWWSRRERFSGLSRNLQSSRVVALTTLYAIFERPWPIVLKPYLKHALKINLKRLRILFSVLNIKIEEFGKR